MFEIFAVLGQTKPNWRAMGVVWLVIAGIVTWSVFRTKRESARDLAKLNATLPDQLLTLWTNLRQGTT